MRVCFMLARVRTPSSQVREREKEREMSNISIEFFIAFNNGSFKGITDALAPCSYLVLRYVGTSVFARGDIEITTNTYRPYYV